MRESEFIFLEASLGTRSFVTSKREAPTISSRAREFSLTPLSRSSELPFARCRSRTIELILATVVSSIARARARLSTFPATLSYAYRIVHSFVHEEVERQKLCVADVQKYRTRRRRITCEDHQTRGTLFVLARGFPRSYAPGPVYSSSSSLFSPPRPRRCFSRYDQ